MAEVGAWIATHWPWIGPLLPVLGGAWAGRRRIAVLIAAARRRVRTIRREIADIDAMAERIASLERTIEICRAERDLMYQSARQLTEAATLVETARSRGLLTTSDSSPNAPSSSPATSPASLSRPGSTTASRSASRRARAKRRA